jgi:REP element-mobilizing transposase RayT
MKIIFFDSPSFFEIKYHFAWRIIGHPSLIETELYNQMREAFDSAAKAVGGKIEFFGVSPWYVDVCVISPPAISPAILAEHLKSATHEILEKTCPAWNSEIVGWGDFNCIASVGSMESGNLINRLLNGADPSKLYDTGVN